MSRSYGPPGSRCLFCGTSTAPRMGGRRPRQQLCSYELTEAYMAANSQVQAYAHHLRIGDQIEVSARICRPCVQRAVRFHEREQGRLAVEADAVEIIIQPSSEGSSDGPASDPLRDDEAIPQEVPLEAPGEVPMQAPEDQVDDVPAVPQEYPGRPAILPVPVPGYTRVSSSSTYCVVAGCNERNNLHRINASVRANILRRENIYIPDVSRVCIEHLNSNIIWQEFADHTRPRHESFNPVQLSNMMQLLKTSNEYLDFEKLETIDESTFQFFTGFNKNAFISILENTPSLQRLRRPKRALATVLCKLHTGDSNDRLSSIFRITPIHFGRIMKIVRYHLMNEFIPLHLGFSRYRENEHDREELRQRILTIPGLLYSNPEHPNSIIVICDGTYIYLQKSSNYSFQKKTYSLHKYRNLLKMFMIVSPDGFIIEAFGPYAADKSDATIMRELIESENFRRFFQPNDVFILDRGFRDSISALEALGYRAFMPKTRGRNDRQLTTQDANDSRKVTICRWVVEAVNGHIKTQFRQLRNQYSNVACRKMREEFRIVCALLNAFGQRFTDHRLVNQIANEINLKQHAPNLLAETVIQHNLNHHRADFQSMDAAVGLEQFPILTKDDLIIMAFGTYQLAQARSYYGEHIKENGAYTVQVCRGNDGNLFPESSWLLRAKIHSRHAGNRTYFVYILINNNMQGRDKIEGHYCSCTVGKRTLGCCSHVMCVVWFLAWARHQDTLPLPPAEFLDSIIVRHDIENEANDEF